MGDNFIMKQLSLDQVGSSQRLHRHTAGSMPARRKYGSAGLSTEAYTGARMQQLPAFP